LADHIKEVLDLDVTLKKSSGGRFEVYDDGELIFSKEKSFRFPEKDEIIAKLKERMTN